MDPERTRLGSVTFFAFEALSNTGQMPVHHASACSEPGFFSKMLKQRSCCRHANGGRPRSSHAHDHVALVINGYVVPSPIFLRVGFSILLNHPSSEFLLRIPNAELFFTLRICVASR